MSMTNKNIKPKTIIDPAKKLGSKPKEVKPKKKMSRSKIIIIVGSCVVLIPLLVFGTILLVAQLQTGSPIVGSRFKGDLDPEITKDNRKDLETAISSISGVENCEVVLETAQLRINVKVDASKTDADIKTLVTTIYQKVNEKLPISTYFTSTAEKKMYDLSISVYNKTNNDDGLQIYYLLTKNSKMTEPTIQLVSKPLDEDLAKELRGEKVDDSVPTEPVVGQEEALEGEEVEETE